MFIVERLVSLLAPHACLGCGAEGALLCEWCRPEALNPLPSRCFRCHKLTSHNEVCTGCRRDTPLKHVWVSSVYEGLSKELVHKLKFNRNYSAAECIAGLICETLPHFDKAVVTHVPTATSRRRQRGYDHAELIAKTLAKRTGLPYVRLLARRGQSRQVGANRTDRLRQLEGMYRLVHPERAKHSRVILVDDIVTTGATLSQAAKTLRRSGIKHIDAAVFAQKVG